MEIETGELMNGEMTDALRPSCYAIGAYDEYSESESLDTTEYENLYALPQ